MKDPHMLPDISINLNSDGNPKLVSVVQVIKDRTKNPERVQDSYWDIPYGVTFPKELLESPLANEIGGMLEALDNSPEVLTDDK